MNRCFRYLGILLDSRLDIVQHFSSLDQKVVRQSSTWPPTKRGSHKYQDMSTVLEGNTIDDYVRDTCMSQILK